MNLVSSSIVIMTYYSLSLYLFYRELKSEKSPLFLLMVFYEKQKNLFALLYTSAIISFRSWILFNLHSFGTRLNLYYYRSSLFMSYFIQIS